MKKHVKYCNKITSYSDVSINSFDKNDKLLQEKNKHPEKSVKPKQKEHSCDDHTIEENAKNVPKNSESSMDNSEIQCSYQNQDLDEFRTHIDFFKENKMHKDVLVRFMKAWTSKDARNNIFLTEFIKLKNEKDRLCRKNPELKTKNTAKNNLKPQNQHLSDFQCNIDDFNANKMDKDVFIHAMKKWTSNDTKKIYMLNEFIHIKNEIEQLQQQLEKRAMDVSNFLFEHDMKVKTEIKDEVDDID